MARFIQLHDTQSGSIININVDFMDSFEDLRKNPSYKESNVYETTLVSSPMKKYYVSETEEEIMALINGGEAGKDVADALKNEIGEWLISTSQNTECSIESIMNYLRRKGKELINTPLKLNGKHLTNL